MSRPSSDSKRRAQRRGRGEIRWSHLPGLLRQFVGCACPRALGARRRRRAARPPPTDATGTTNTSRVRGSGGGSLCEGDMHRLHSWRDCAVANTAAVEGATQAPGFRPRGSRASEVPAGDPFAAAPGRGLACGARGSPPTPRAGCRRRVERCSHSSVRRPIASTASAA
jgi:hypothetical protein